ncbi:MAG: photosynthetic complex putative assembly protein PuhB [Hyphomicrobiaceae bacterium]
MRDHHDDFEFEPIAGLPKALPKGETILWSGSPEKWRLGHQIFATRWVALVFVVLALSSLFSGLTPNATTTQLAVRFLMILTAGAAVVAFAATMGWLIAINTVYTITDKRLVIRHGVTMPMAVNVPFTKIASASAKVETDGSGDVAVALLDGNRVSLFAIWPHNRPWNWQGAAPAIRCIPDAGKVAAILHEALVADVRASGDVYVGEKPKVAVRTRDHERGGSRRPSITGTEAAA